MMQHILYSLFRKSQMECKIVFDPTIIIKKRIVKCMYIHCIILWLVLIKKVINKFMNAFVQNYNFVTGAKTFNKCFFL